MKRTDARLTKRETLPVADSEGKLLGTCVVSKFIRKSGEAYNEILIQDTGHRPVAEIRGYRLHSRVQCGRLKTDNELGECEGNSRRIDSKNALTVARIALEHIHDAAQMLDAIQEIALSLANEKRVKA